MTGQDQLDADMEELRKRCADYVCYIRDTDEPEYCRDFEHAIARQALKLFFLAEHEELWRKIA